jgi:hypothetical protein
VREGSEGGARGERGRGVREGSEGEGGGARGSVAREGHTSGVIMPPVVNEDSMLRSLIE